MMYRSDSRVFTSPFADVTGKAWPGARSPGHQNGNSLHPNASRMPSAADIAGRAVAHAEAIQARLFEAVLLVEIVHLQDLAKSMPPRGTWGGADGHQPHKALTELDARIEEVHRLLRALRDRFPHSHLVGGPSEAGLNSPGDRTPPAPGSRRAIQDRRQDNSGGRQIVFPRAAGRRAVP